MKQFMLFVVLTGFLGCSRKEDPVPVPTEPNPVFYVRGLVEGSHYLLEAGEDFNGKTNYMHSFYQADTNYFQYCGNLLSCNGSQCSGMSFVFNAAMPGFDTTQTDSMVKATFYPGKKIPLASGGSATAYLNYHTYGLVYSTRFITQPDTSYYIRILSVKDYLPNKEGKPTKRIRFTFSCLTYNPLMGDNIELKNMEAAIAVAYK